MKTLFHGVPKLLDDEHIKNHMAAGLDFLFHYHADGKDFLDHIVTGNEKWVHHYTPEMKNVAKQWVAEGEDPPLKAKHEPSTGVHRLHNQSETYFDTMMNLRITIKKKQRGKLSKGVVLIHNNAIPHKARLIQNLIADFAWDVFGHPLHSPTLRHQTIIYLTIFITG